MLTEQEINKFFEILKEIEVTAPKIAEELEQIRNSVFGFTFFMATKDKHPLVHVDSEEGVSVEYYIGSGNSDSLSIPLYTLVDINWQQKYLAAQEIEFKTQEERKQQKDVLDKKTQINFRKQLYEKLKKEFEE